MIMANLNDLDDEEFGLEGKVDNTDLPKEEPEKIENEESSNQDVNLDNTEPDDINISGNSTEQDDIIMTFLKSKGINPDSIKFENEKGETEERRFSDLPLDEQMEILKYDDKDMESALDNNEINLINELRSGDLTPDEYKQYLKQQGVGEYLQSIGEEPDVATSIDSISDDEIYLADLKSRFPEITDDEAIAKLESEKANEDLFAREVKGLRDMYKQREIEQHNAEQEQLEQQQKLASEQFANTVINTIASNSAIDIGDATLDLSDSEKEEIASFILDSDAAGVRHIAKALNDPQTLVGMSWYALHGQEAFRQLSDYYKQKITEASKNNYSKGYEDAKAGRNPTKTIVRKTTKTNNNKPISINDID